MLQTSFAENFTVFILSKTLQYVYVKYDTSINFIFAFPANPYDPNKTKKNTKDLEIAKDTHNTFAIIL